MITFFRSWKNYHLILITCCYGTGIALSLSLSVSFWFLLIALSLTLLGSLYCSRSRRPNLSILLVSFAFLLFGSLRADSVDPWPLDHDHIVTKVSENQQVVLVGTLAKKVSFIRDASRALMKVSFYRSKGETGYKPASGKILLNLKGQWPDHIYPGQSFIVLATLTYPGSTDVPGTFDYEKFLARQKVFITGFVQGPVMMQPVEQLEISLWDQTFYLIERWRAAIGEFIETILPDATSSLFKALLIGDRSSISPEQLETFKRSGILHILAISGLHLGLLATMLCGSIYWLLLRSERLILTINVRKWAMLFALPPLLLYALLAGSKPPVVRAFIMVLCLTISLAFGRLASPITSLLTAALVILLIDPMALETPSFQLSFGAVGAIILITPRLLFFADFSARNQWSFLVPIARPLASLAAVTLSATLGTLPLLFFHFNRVSLVTLLSNLLVEPVICLFVLPLGLASIPFIFISQNIAELLLKTGAYGLELSQHIITFLSSSDATQLWRPAPPPFLCGVYYIFLFTFALSKSRGNLSLLSLCGVVTVTAYFCAPLPGDLLSSKSPTSIAILDIGHGSANLIKFEGGRVVLIDGGNRNSGGYDCGDKAIAPFLWQRNIDKVDDIIITHDDADHYNGIPTVMRRFKPERLWLPHGNSHKKGFKDLLDLARKLQVDIITADSGKIIDLGDEHLSVLGKNSRFATASEDDNGLVLRLQSHDFAIIFPGDITEAREQRLIREESELKSQVLVAAHHGSATSNSFEFLSAVSPDYLMISSGDKNANFPASQTLNSARALNITTLTTSRDGTIEISLTEHDQGYAVTTFSRSDRSFWKKS